ncbi:MAG: sulfurtransferase TusA family protein [Atribacterota bacterium]|nr:sulfurtransferase TusA family protein [Atribacterota bacterium]
MSKIKIDYCGETCPIPLIETRKAIRKASPGDIIEINGPLSFKDRGTQKLAEKLTIVAHIGEE